MVSKADRSDLFRIGYKLVSRQKVEGCLERIFYWREQGYSQQEVARKLDLERSFISRLEKLGEIRKGCRLAVVGFPIANKKELTDLAVKAGAEYVWIMDNQERWEIINERTALDFFNYVMEKLHYLKEFDTLLLLTSEKWYQMALALLNNQVVFVDLGSSPIEGDCVVAPERLETVLKELLE